MDFFFPSRHVWMWELDYKGSWVPKNWCLWTVVLEKTLERVPWTARRSNQSILKNISPEYALEGLMLKLKLQYFGDLMWRTDSLEKTPCWERLKAGREGKGRGWNCWTTSPTQWTWVWASSRNWWWAGSLACCSPWSCKESDTTKRLNRRDESSKYSCHSYIFWMSWSLPLLQGWFPYSGKESVRKCVLCLVHRVWSRHTFPWANYTSFNQNLAGFLKLSLSLWPTNIREDWQKQYKNCTLAI